MNMQFDVRPSRCQVGKGRYELGQILLLSFDPAKVPYLPRWTGWQRYRLLKEEEIVIRHHVNFACVAINTFELIRSALGNRDDSIKMCIRDSA